MGNPLKARSEEHTSELQSQSNLVCRLLLGKKNVESAPARHRVGPPAGARRARRAPAPRRWTPGGGRGVSLLPLWAWLFSMFFFFLLPGPPNTPPPSPPPPPSAP